MQKSIKLHKENINYTLKVSKRAKRMRLAVYCDGSCVLTIPRALPQTMIEKFLIKKSQWLLDKINYFRSAKNNTWKVDDKEDFLKYKQQALLIAETRVAYFNKFYKYSWNKITIKNQKTRWGSCSKKGNLNFNYKIALLPPHMADYIIVHELCHLGQFNHSQKFWNLVSRAMPNYLEIRNELKKNGMSFF
jgi:predicted metal-dependent hydrolase